MKMNYEDFLENVKEDLQELYNSGLMLRAEKLNYDLGITFGSAQEPFYFSGKFYSPTVFVMLNPGEKADKDAMKEPKAVNKECYKTFDAFWESYIKGKEHIKVKDKVDNFDLKQAAFLFDFEDKGFDLPDFINPLLTDKTIKLDALRTVLHEKLQLELIPYCSKDFDTKNKNFEVFRPYIDRIFDAILSTERKYVIFGSRFFADMFDLYNNTEANKIEFIKRDVKTALKNGTKQLKASGSCSVVKINHDGKAFYAIIANTFPHQALPNAYDAMRQYGKFCLNTLVQAQK